MPSITDPPPPEVQADLDALQSYLDAHVPAKELDRNLLVATWNIRAFGGLTTKWRASARDTPKRDLHALLCIAEIVSRFDVVALQEIRGNLKALRHMLRVLNDVGRHWGLILTDVTRGAKGNNERTGFVFDTRRVRLSGLAAELVVPPEREATDEHAFARQFARTPYAVSFVSSDQTFILVTLHVIFGERASQRVGELTEIAKWLADWASQVNAWDHNLIALGDFNIDRRGDALFNAFTSTGLRTPQKLNEVPRTIFGGAGAGKHYDQIAWFTGDGDVPKLSLRYTGRAGSADFTELVLRSLSRAQKSWRISDHYPLWVEFSTRSD